MAVARTYWDAEKASLSDGSKELLARRSGTSQAFISYACTVLQYLPEIATQVLSGSLSLKEAYELAKKKRQKILPKDIDPDFVTFNGTDEQAFHFALSENIKRRNTTASQRAASAVLAQPIWAKFSEDAVTRERAGIANPSAILQQGRTADHVAKLFGTGVRYVYDAKALSELAAELDELLTRAEPHFGSFTTKRIFSFCCTTR